MVIQTALIERMLGTAPVEDCEAVARSMQRVIGLLLAEQNGDEG